MLVKRGASGSTLRQGQGGPRPTRRGRALVSTSSTSRKPSSTSRGDGGSALVSVVVLMLVLTSGDERKTIEWDVEIVRQAAQAGWTLDANGCTAPKHFVDRAQR